MEYYSAIKKDKIMPFATTWNAIRDSHTKLIKSERERQITYNIIYMRNLKYGTNESVYKTETHSQSWRTDLWFPRGTVEGGMNAEFGVSRCKLLHFE